MDWHTSHDGSLHTYGYRATGRSARRRSTTTWATRLAPFGPSVTLGRVDPRPTTVAQAGLIVGLLELLLHTVLVFYVVAGAFLYWFVAWPWVRRRHVSLGQFLGWVDLNLVAAIEATMLRPFIPTRYPWTPWSELPNVTHRIVWRRFPL